MADDVSDATATWLTIGFFGLIFLLIGIDVAGDYADGAHGSHLLLEIGVMLGAAGGIATLLQRYLGARRSLRRLADDLARARADAAHWRDENRELLRGLGRAIENQFARWNLSPAEAEIGLLLLKGLSHKELAALRNTSERTVREQARAVYRKAGLGGRSELAAFFLEDILLPGATGPGSQA